MPLISVITAAHQTGSAIEVPWRSLLAQTHTDWEWVVVDDSPEPDTSESLTRLAASASAEGRITCQRRDTHGSIGASKAQAARLCRGEVLVELDHDDELLPDALKGVDLAFESDHDLDFVYSDWVDRLGGAGVSDATALYPTGWGLGFGAYATEIIAGVQAPAALAPAITWETVRHIVSMPNHLRAWKLSAYRRIGGFDPQIAVGDDYELLVRTVLHGSMARIPRPLYVQHHDPSGTSASRVHNAAIMDQVTLVAAARQRDLDERCLSLGAVPHRPAPLTSPEPLHRINVQIDPLKSSMVNHTWPLVSVILPVSSHSERVRLALESVLDQSYANVEVLVIGGEGRVIDNAIAELSDPRVRHWNLEDHHDDLDAAARNYALKTMARGSLISYVDDQAAWDHTHLEAMLEALAEREAAFALSCTHAEGEAIVRGDPNAATIGTTSIVHGRELLERYGYWRPRLGTDELAAPMMVARWHREPWVACGSG